MAAVQHIFYISAVFWSNTSCFISTKKTSSGCYKQSFFAQIRTLKHFRYKCKVVFIYFEQKCIYFELLTLLERRLEGSVAIEGIVKYKAIAVDWSEPVEKNKLFAYPRSQPSLVFPLVSL